MLDHAHDQIQSPVFTSSRRTFLTATAAMLLTSGPAAAQGSAHEEQMPWWWDKLSGPDAATDPEVYHPWPITSQAKELAVKIAELHDLLLRIGAADGVDTITDLRLSWHDGVPQNVITTGRSGAYGEGLHCYRPELGWIDYSARIAA